MKSIIITSQEEGQRLDKFLGKYMKSAPMSFFYKMMRKKNIVLNKKKAAGNELLRAGDCIDLFLSDDTIASFQPEQSQSSEFESRIAMYRSAYKQMTIHIVYEDTDICVVNKPSGVLSQKATNKDISLNEWFIGYLLDSNQMTKKQLETFIPSICNRLDRNTSGMVCCAKTLRGARVLSDLLSSRTLHKYYICRTLEKCTKTGKVTSYLVKNEAINKSIIYDFEHEIPQNLRQSAVMITSVITVLHETTSYTELEVELLTGKSHQIRAQLAHFGMPLCGDIKYGGSKQKDAQMLHCYRLHFPKEVAELPNLNGLELICKPSWEDSDS